ncbi:MAG: hypothetical protein ACO32J_06995 [Phycisphaerales bacterium]
MTMAPEKPVRLHPTAAFGGWAASAAVAAGAAWLGGPAGLWSSEVAISAVLGSALASAVMLVGLLAMAPWGLRTPSEWSTRWLAATVIRFIGTPFLALLLYSRPPSAEGFLLAVAGSYLLSLAVETAVVAQGVLSAVGNLTRGSASNQT